MQVSLGRTTSLSWDSCWKPSSVHTLHFWQILNGSLLVHPLRLHAVFLHLHAVRHPCVAVYLSSSGLHISHAAQARSSPDDAAHRAARCSMQTLQYRPRSQCLRCSAPLSPSGAMLPGSMLEG